MKSRDMGDIKKDLNQTFRDGKYNIWDEKYTRGNQRLDEAEDQFSILEDRVSEDTQ